MNEVLLIAGMTLVTFGVRYPVLALFGKIPLPMSVLRALRYVPSAVLTAIIVPAILLPDDTTLQFGLNNPYLVAGIAAMLVAWRTKTLLPTIVVGMATLWIWRALIGG